jgi:peptidoglycan/LPS O-acetylase OafA/YrhL
MIGFIDKYFLHTGRGVVSFFFFISGFVICYSYQNWSGWKSFFIRRFARVYPNHWIVSLTFASFTFLIPLLNKENLLVYLRNAVLNLTLLQAFVPDRLANFAFNGVTWTLSVEFFFYLAFIFLRRWSTKTLVLLFLTLYVSKLALETIWILFDIHHFAHWLFFVFPILRLPEFLLGMVMCRIYFKNPEAFSRFRINPFIIIISTILTIGSCRYYISPYAVCLYSTIPSIFGFLLLLSCLGYNNCKSAFFNNKICLFLGEASFSIYLIHQPILNGARKLFQKFGLTMTVGQTVITMLLSLVLAVGYFLLVERRVYHQFVKFLTSSPS